MDLKSTIHKAREKRKKQRAFKFNDINKLIHEKNIVKLIFTRNRNLSINQMNESNLDASYIKL